MGKYIHITEKKVRGSGLYVVDEVSRGKYLLVDSIHAFSEIMKGTGEGDSLIFHGRACVISAMPFLAYNRIAGRNRVGYQPHTRLRPIKWNRLVLNSFFDAVFCLTEHNRQELAAYGVKNAIVVPNPIPVGRIAPHVVKNPKKEYDAVWAGRDAPCKRVAMFINAAKKEGSAKALVLAPRLLDGNRPCLDGAKNVRLVEGLDGKGFFSALQSAKAFFFTSDENEGFPISLLEAAYLRLPIVASDYPKYRELLGDYAIYWRSEEDLARLIGQAAGKNGIEVDEVELEKVLSRFSPEEIIRKYESW